MVHDLQAILLQDIEPIVGTVVLQLVLPNDALVSSVEVVLAGIKTVMPREPEEEISSSVVDYHAVVVID